MELAEKTGLTVLQLNNWFINSRRRKFKSLIDKSRPQLQQTNKDKSKQSGAVEHELKKGRLSCPYCQESFYLKKYLTNTKVFFTQTANKFEDNKNNPFKIQLDFS